MDQRIGQRFPQGFVQRRVVNAVGALQLEWYLDVLRDPIVDAEVKVAEIAAPIPRAGNDPVGPALVGGGGAVVFLVVEEIKRELPHDLVLVAEHQQTGGRGAQAALGLPRHRADAVQELLGGQF